MLVKVIGRPLSTEYMPAEHLSKSPLCDCEGTCVTGYLLTFRGNPYFVVMIVGILCTTFSFPFYGLIYRNSI